MLAWFFLVDGHLEMNRNTLYLIYDYMIFYDFDPAPPIPSLEEHSAVFFFNYGASGENM